MLRLALIVGLCLACTRDGWVYRPLPRDGGVPTATDVTDVAEATDAADARVLRVTGRTTSAGTHESSALRVTGSFEAPARQCAGARCVSGALAP